MHELFAIKNVYSLYEGNQLLVMLGIMVIAFYPLLVIIKKLILPSVGKIVDKKNTNYTKIFAKHNLSKHVVWLFVAIYLMLWGDFLNKSDLMSATMASIKNVVLDIYVVITITSLLLTLMDVTVDLYQSKRKSVKVAIGLHMNILKLVVTICSVLSVFSLILSIPISSLFTSLGAAAALLTFVFKDTVLGLLASLQLTFQNIIQVGDWVTLPQYNADGDIKKITITVVVIRNFDGTYTTVPTSAFLLTSVKNWRQMFEEGGRRIKRSISLDMDTIKICDQTSLNVLKKMPTMLALAKESPELFNAKDEKTNISMFRYYIEQYLRSNQEIHQEGFTFLVRELDPTPTGIPIELYVFTKDTRWANYETIQADIFDHLLGVLPKFGLKAFQTIIRP
jgi:miniconductance mechanosensitive channel